jgi:hypothetical protein
MYIRFSAAVIAVGAGCALGQPALAQAVSLDALKGHSVLLSHHERVHRRNGEVFEVSWNDRIYVSSEGRIFHRVDRRSTRPGRGAQREVVGEAEGGGRRFRWTGQGLVRAWTNREGRQIGQTVQFSSTGSGLGCAMSVSRQGRAYVQTISSSCRVVRGNVFAGQGS